MSKSRRRAIVVKEEDSIREIETKRMVGRRSVKNRLQYLRMLVYGGYDSFEFLDEDDDLFLVEDGVE